MTATIEETPVYVRWVEALRSGKYKQTRKYLHTTDGFCCLGVLCDLTGEAGWKPSDTEQGVFLTADGLTGMPDSETLAWANLGDRASEQLADMNDKGATFEDIADEIERMYATGDHAESFNFGK